jgi:hypothetical protein
LRACYIYKSSVKSFGSSSKTSNKPLLLKNKEDTDKKFLSIIDILIFQIWNSMINIILNDEFEFQTVALTDICVSVFLKFQKQKEKERVMKS